MFALNTLNSFCIYIFGLHIGNVLYTFTIFCPNICAKTIIKL